MALLKRIAIAFCAAIVLPALIHAEQIAQDQFGYLNNNESSAIIDPTEAQDLLNVDITPSGKSIRKRAGYGIYKTLTSGQPIHGAIHFYDSSGNDVQVWGSSTSLWGIVSDAAATQLISSATLNATWDCADTQGYAYCVNSSRDALIKTDGAVKTWYASPLGTMVAITPARLLVAGVAGNPNMLYVSGDSNFTNFTTGNNPTDPFTEVIAAPGSKLTHIEYACNRILWWKDQSFGYILGDNQTNISIAIVSNSIGTTDNSSAIDPDGNVYFRAQDGHIYKFDCASLTRLTTDIAPNIQQSGRRTSNMWQQTSASDFSAGSVSSTSISGNDIVLSTYTAGPTSANFEQGGGFQSIANWSLTQGVNTSLSNIQSNQTLCGVTSTAQSGSWYFGMGITGSVPVATSVQVVDTSSNVIVETALPNSGGTCSWTYAQILSTGNAGGTYRVRIKVVNGGDTAYALSSNFSFGGGIGFWYKVDSGTQRFAEVDNIINFPTTGLFSSAVRNASALTAWDTFQANTASNGGTHSFFMRSALASFTVNSSTPAWFAVTPGQVPSLSTGTYFQVKDSFTITNSTQTPVLNDFTVNWFEGVASDKAYAIYFDQAIWWALAFGSGQTTNNYIFKYDLLNPGWTLYNFGAGGFLIQNNSLYFGSPSSASIFKFGNSYSDNGTAINAYWKSKDYAGSDPWLENEFQQIEIMARRDQNETLSVGYYLNASTSATTYNVSLSSATDNVIRHKKLLPIGKIGGLFNIQFSDTSSGAPWEVLGFRATYRPLTYRPTQ